MSLNKETTLDAVMDIIIEKLDSGGTVTFTPNGTSMLPMLRDGQDIVVLKKPEGRLHLFDIPLYRRKSGQYVLHRVIDFCRDGSYVLCGDNQFKKEKGIRDDQVIAVVIAFSRKGKVYSSETIRYRIYVNFWYYTRIFRHAFRSAKYRLGFTGKKKNKSESAEASGNPQDSTKNNIQENIQGNTQDNKNEN